MDLTTLGDEGSAFMPNEADIFGSEENAPMVAEFGTVGWAESDPHFDIDTSDADGTALIKVTLFRGHPAGAPMLGTAANGYQILAQPTFPLWFIPQKGMRCVILFPSGLTTTPGAGVIVAYPGKCPSRQFKESTAKLSFEGHNLVIKAKSIAIRDDSNNVISVSKDGGLRIEDSTGSGIFVHEGKIIIKVVKDGELKTSVTLDAEQAALSDNANNAAVKVSAGSHSFTGKDIYLSASGSIGLGQNPNASTPVVIGTTGIAGVGSQQIFASG